MSRNRVCPPCTGTEMPLADYKLTLTQKKDALCVKIVPGEAGGALSFCWRFEISRHYCQQIAMVTKIKPTNCCKQKVVGNWRIGENCADLRVF